MYFPKSQIITNLFTNGNEFVYVKNKLPYIGYYWKTSSGKFYTGKTPQDLPNEEIMLFKAEGAIVKETTENNSYYNQYDDTTSEYLKLTNPSPPASSPIYFQNRPTDQDYQIGEFRRYFCKKTNEIIYIEISRDTYDKLIGNDPSILYELYFPFTLAWQLTGDKVQVYNTNKDIAELTSVRLKLPMFLDYLKHDFTKFYKFLN